MFDVRSVASESFLQGILCPTNILYATLTAFDQIDYTLCPAVGRCRHLVGFFGDSTAESVCSLDVWASLTASAVAWAVSSVFRDGDSKLEPHFFQRRAAESPTAHYVFPTILTG